MKKKQNGYEQAVRMLKGAIAILQQYKVYEGDAKLAKSYIDIAKLEIDAIK